MQCYIVLMHFLLYGYLDLSLVQMHSVACSSGGGCPRLSHLPSSVFIYPLNRTTRVTVS